MNLYPSCSYETLGENILVIQLLMVFYLLLEDQIINFLILVNSMPCLFSY